MLGGKLSASGKFAKARKNNLNLKNKPFKQLPFNNDKE